MPAWVFTDWTLWVLTSLAGLIGFALAVREIMGHSARGRPHCWRCRYVMVNAKNLSCPECGHPHKNRKHLFKTRRYWKRLLLGVLLFWLALYCHTAPGVQARRGIIGETWWESVTPTAYWLLHLPQMGEERYGLIQRRLWPFEVEDNPAPPLSLFVDDLDEDDHYADLPRTKTLTSWEASILVSSCLQILEREAASIPPTETQGVWIDVEPKWFLVRWIVAVRHQVDVLPALVALSTHPSDAIRYRAILAMGCLDDQKADGTEQLRALLGASDPHDREAAVIALGHISKGSPAAVADLMHLWLNDSEPGVRHRAAKALVNVGPPAVEPLLALVFENRAPESFNAIDLLAEMNESSRAAWPALFKLAAAPEGGALARYARGGLHKLGGHVVPLLIEHLNDRDLPLALAAMDQLTIAGPDREAGVPALLSIALGSDEQRADAAANAIMQIALSKDFLQTLSRQTWIDLFSALASPRDRIRRFARNVIFEADPDLTLPWLESMLRQDKITPYQGPIEYVLHFKHRAARLLPLVTQKMLADPQEYGAALADVVSQAGADHEMLHLLLDAADPPEAADGGKEDAATAAARRQAAEAALLAAGVKPAALAGLLADRLGRPDARRRLGAVNRLAALGTDAAGATATLKKLAEVDKDADVRRAAGQAVAAIERNAQP